MYCVTMISSGHHVAFACRRKRVLALCLTSRSARSARKLFGHKAVKDDACVQQAAAGEAHMSAKDVSWAPGLDVLVPRSGLRL
jgi:hypothetical protein